MHKMKTTHVGSLPRPQAMMAKALRKQEITRDELRQHLTQIVEKQLALGLTYINNGELPRTDYVNATVSRIAGFADTATAPIPQDLEALPELSARFSGRNGLITLNPKAPVTLPACSKPLAYTGEASLREELDMLIDVYNEVKPADSQADGALFFTAPSPGTVGLFMENRFYAGEDEYLENLAAVLKAEYDLIAARGLHLQIDCPDLAMGRHIRFKHLTDEGFLDRIDTHVRVLNQALAGIDPARCRVHICWGNYPGTHHCDIELKTILPHVAAVNAGFISLEASNHRHAHEWNVFKEMAFPEDKVLLPGVIDTSSNTVEHPDLVAQRLCQFADILGPERVVASTDCGFATTASATGVSGEVAWLKLAALVEGARRAGVRYG